MLLRDVPSCSGKWAIAVTATYKSPTNKYKANDGREGKVFNVTFKDSSASVKTAFFGEVADKFDSCIVVGEVHAFII